MSLATECLEGSQLCDRPSRLLGNFTQFPQKATLRAMLSFKCMKCILYDIPYGPYVLYHLLLYICPSSMISSKHVVFLSGFATDSIDWFRLFSLGLQRHLRDAQRRQGHRLTQHRAFPTLHRNANSNNVNGTLGKGLFMSFASLGNCSVWASSLFCSLWIICTFAAGFADFHSVYIDPFWLFHEQNS